MRDDKNERRLKKKEKQKHYNGVPCYIKIFFFQIEICRNTEIRTKIKLTLPTLHPFAMRKVNVLLEMKIHQYVLRYDLISCRNTDPKPPLAFHPR